MEQEITDLIDNQELFTTLALKFQKEQIRKIKEIREPDIITEGILESMENDFRNDLKKIEDSYKLICEIVINKIKRQNQQNCSKEI